MDIIFISELFLTEVFWKTRLFILDCVYGMMLAMCTWKYFSVLNYTFGHILNTRGFLIHAIAKVTV